MNDAEVAASIAQAREWSEQELLAYANAMNWLHQAANNEVPHGEATCLALNAEQPYTTKIPPMSGKDSGDVLTAEPTTPQLVTNL